MAVSGKTRAKRDQQARNRWKKRQAKREEPTLEPRYDWQMLTAHLPEAQFEKKQDEVTVHLFDLTISYDAIPDPSYHHLPKEWRERLDPSCLEHHEKKDLPQYVALLEEAAAANLAVPRLGQILGTAYMVMQRYEEAGEVFLELTQRYPDYLFGYISYANWLIHKRRAEDVAELFHHQMDMSFHLRGRKLVHVSEFIAFYGMLVQYYLARNELKRAGNVMDILEQTASHHPSMPQLRLKMINALVEGVAAWRLSPAARTTP
jgi:tetratricopeptide (TPR) repeat protein